MENICLLIVSSVELFKSYAARNNDSLITTLQRQNMRVGLQIERWCVVLSILTLGNDRDSFNAILHDILHPNGCIHVACFTLVFHLIRHLVKFPIWWTIYHLQ